jgi:hypothetical protein
MWPYKGSGPGGGWRPGSAGACRSCVGTPRPVADPATTIGRQAAGARRLPSRAAQTACLSRGADVRRARLTEGDVSRSAYEPSSAPAWAQPRPVIDRFEPGERRKAHGSSRRSGKACLFAQGAEPRPGSPVSRSRTFMQEEVGEMGAGQ